MEYSIAAIAGSITGTAIALGSGIIIGGAVWYRNRHKNPAKAKWALRAGIIVSAVLTGISILSWSN